MLLINKLYLPLITPLIILSGCTSSGGVYTPPEALSPPTIAVSEGIAEFGVQVQKETLANYRRSAREDLIHSDIYNFLTGSNLKKEVYEENSTSAIKILCQPRYGYDRIAIPLQNSVAKANAFKVILKKPSDDTAELFKALTVHYDVDVTENEIEADYDAWTRGGGKNCIESAEKGNPFITRDYISKEFAPLAGVTAVKTLYESVWPIIQEAVKSGLQNIDLERRNQTIAKYFSDKKHVADLKEDITHIESFLQKEFSVEQTKTAGLAVAQIKILQNYESDHWKAALSIANSKKCKNKLNSLGTNKTDVVGVTCLNEIFEIFSPEVTKALDASDKFDGSMDRTLPKEKLSNQIDTIALIAQGGDPDGTRAKALWGALVRYANLYKSVKETAADENKKKIKDALKAFDAALE